MKKSSRYRAREADADGVIRYRDAEHQRWGLLLRRQREILPRYAAPAYLDALQRLELPADHIPQCAEISERLLDLSGWRVVPVPALIDFAEFFDLLARRRFPAASFIRSARELDYLQEPDIFHEILGHAPLLGDPRYAAFVQAYGETGRRAAPRDRAWLARLFWFTVEFGLLRGSGDMRAFGAGIVSSHAELPYSVEARDVERRDFDLLRVLRTPYRIDILQPVYYVLDDLEQMLALAERDLLPAIARARRLGLEAPRFQRASA